VRNAALDAARGAKRRVPPVNEDEVADPAALHLERIANEAQAGTVKSFFTTLSPRQRELIELVDLQGYTAVEAAEVMGIEPQTARVHLMRARRTLREKMLEKHAR
jgi:RNA polymerase sigma-70 factor (ECF subfamily)